MKKLVAFIVGGLISTSAFSQGYDNYQGGKYSFDTVVSLSTGKAELDDVEGDANIHSAAVAFDFHRFPVELELRYSGLSSDYTYSTYEGDVLIEEIKLEGQLNNIGLGAKLDLSWNCQEVCAYLMAGYNFSDLSVDGYYNGDKAGDYSTDVDFAHWGAGVRYDFTNNLRATIEYLQYNIGKQKLDAVEGFELGEVDFGKATAWQAGVGYRF